ncbi:helix-turn-helix domain-containing protein [Humitalea sp. 24SJ18S-53]|uniref:helix-turn-helix domain-containing protein n=1 Tax=Humitalea sp. 24SJ18S-53 TaxID=3422307 RepID=UPI003D675E4B
MRAYAEDLRERAVQRAEAGETIRSIAEALQISPSCVSQWRNRLRETGRWNLARRAATSPGFR